MYGALANKPMFFGTALAEVTSANVSIVGGWNGDGADSVRITDPYAAYGGRVNDSARAGTFSSWYGPGSFSEYISHRTILLGY